MNRHRMSFHLLAIAMATAGCQFGPGPILGPPPPPGPAPSITSLSPSSVTAGSSALTLTLNGSNFRSGAFVVWKGQDNPGFGGGPATFVSSSQITLQLSAPDIAIPGTAQVQVLNPDGGDSNTINFIIHPGAPGGAQVVSVAANGGTPNGNSHDPVLSFNGRFVGFGSEATNLVPGGTNFAEGYLRDTCLGADNCTASTLLVSAETGGSAASPMEGNALGGASLSIGLQGFPASGAGLPPAGRYLGFVSTATNLVASSTAYQQAYYRDDCLPGISASGCMPTTVLVSTTQSGGEPNGPATEFVLSGNNCNGAFVSAGTNLLNGVTTPNEVYLSDCGVTESNFSTVAVVSASSAGVPGNQGGQQPAIDAVGRFVAFVSTSTNLTSTPNGGLQQIYLRDTCPLAGSGCSPSTSLVSVDNAGNALAGNSELPAVSDDGRFVAFTTQTPAAGGGLTSDVFVRDTCSSSSGAVMNCTPSTTAVSVAADGGPTNGPSNSTAHAISGSGRFVVFSSSATNLIVGGNLSAQVFVRDTCNSSTGSVAGCTPRTVLVSVGNAGPTGGFDAAISEDGHFVAFVNDTIGPVQQVLVAATGF